MSSEKNFSNLHNEPISYDLDKFIEKLYDCIPLRTEEVKFLIEKAKEILLKESKNLNITENDKKEIIENIKR